MIDLAHVGLGAEPTATLRPPRRWAGVGTSAHTIIKASRAVLEVESMAFGLGLSRADVIRLRPLLIVLECAVYDWDEAAEYRTHDHGASAAHVDELHRLVSEIVDLDDPIRTEIDGLRRLGAAERAALAEDQEGAGPAADDAAFRAVSEARSCDLRLLVRIIATLAGWPGDVIVSTVQPMLELMEVDDDLSTVSEDAASDSYNSYLLLRRHRSASQTQERLDDFAAEQTDELLRRLAELPPPVLTQVASMLCYPRTRLERGVVAGLAGLSPRVALALVRLLVAPRLRSMFSPRWPELAAS